MSQQGRIMLEGLVFWARHGVHPHEREKGNCFELDIAVSVCFTKAAWDDCPSGTIDYETLYALAAEEMNKPPKKLMEPIAYALAQRILTTFKNALNVNVTLAKLAPSIGGICKKAKIEVTLKRP